MKVNDHVMLEAALSMFKRNGIRATHLTAIAQACGVRLAELKDRFESKKVLVSAFVDFLLLRHSSYLQVNPVLSPTSITELENYFLFIEKLAGELTPSMLRELKKYSENGWFKLQDFKYRKLTPYLQQNLKRGISEGFYRDDIEPEQYVKLYFDVLFDIVTGINIPYGETKRALALFHKIFLRGLLSTRGIKM